MTNLICLRVGNLFRLFLLIIGVLVINQLIGFTLLVSDSLLPVELRLIAGVYGPMLIFPVIGIQVSVFLEDGL